MFQIFFLRTLGFTKDQCVNTALESAKRVIVPLKEKRGRKAATNKFSEDIPESVKNHIFKYNPAISHYRRKHAPHRLYISPAFDVATMYRDYKASIGDNVSYSYDLNIVKSHNAQNKNCWLFTALIAEVNRPEGPNSITIKYFEPGHTMSCDCFHHQVELKMKKQKRVEDFEDFKSVIGDRGVAIEMKIEDIFQYPRGVSTGKFASGNPKVDDMQVVMFAKGTKHIYWKKCFADESFSSAAFLQKKVASFIDKHQHFESYCSNRGIQLIKKNSILSKNSVLICYQVDVIFG